jgi:Arc/MetJ-type ribon-helix-helix transcriptional regulator
MNDDARKSVRVVLPVDLYNELKDRCVDYGNLSKVVRFLLRKWIDGGGSMRDVYEDEDRRLKARSAGEK